MKLTEKEKQLILQKREEEERSKPKFVAKLAHDLYAFDSGVLENILDEMGEFFPLPNREIFSKAFEKILNKDTPFVGFVGEDGNVYWYDEANLIEGMDSDWAKIHLIDIKPIKQLTLKTNEITEKIVKSLSDENITIKEYDIIIKVINEKVNEIWNFICKKGKVELEWWSFRNDAEGDESTGGSFDPVEDKDFIVIVYGNKSKNPFFPYHEGFPTEYLWSDYKTKVLKEISASEIKWKKQIKDKTQKQLTQEKTQ